jgi:hypothetical protein
MVYKFKELKAIFNVNILRIFIYNIRLFINKCENRLNKYPCQYDVIINQYQTSVFTYQRVDPQSGTPELVF